jgi:hypothetical protein
MDRYRGRALKVFEFALAVCLIAIFSIFLLDRLLYYQEAAEKARVESTVLNLKSALRMRMGEMMIESRAHRWADLERENPFDWLVPKPDNYCGEARGPENVREGCWVYQPESRIIIYRVRRSRHFQSALETEPLIRYSVKARFSSQSSYNFADRNSKELALADTVELILLEPYRWF